MDKAKRALFISNLLQNCSQRQKHQACKAAGLRRNAPARILKLLQDTGGIDDKPRSGAPAKYTSEVFDKALDVLRDNPKARYTSKEYFKLLKERGVVHSSAKDRRFFAKLTKWARSQGMLLNLHCTKVQFMIEGPKAAKKRLSYAQIVQKTFEEHPIEDFIFVDETSIDYGPHPKSG